MKKSELRQIIREEIHNLLVEEEGLTKKFDKTIGNYRLILQQQQDMIKKFKEEYSKAKDKNKYKEDYIKKMDKINAELFKAKLNYDSAIFNLVIPREEELV